MHPDHGSSEFEGTARFQVLRRLGGGGMGVVYEALDKERNAHIALKTLRTLDATAILRFKNEFRWLQDLQHPNLVSFGELFAEDGQWFFTMELIDGSDFLSWVRHWREPPETASPEAMPEAMIKSLDEQRLRSGLVQLANGLQALHAAQKIHRDIKPSNILVTPNGRVVLLDFGLAKQTTKPGMKQSDTHVVGTVDYMAPEQAASKAVGPEADWYSVGTLLFEALTGRLPFGGAPLEVLMAKQSQLAPSVRMYNRDAPADLEALCAELLRADPAGRPTGVQVLWRLGGAGPQALAPAPASRPSGVSAPFVGRRRELEELERAYESLPKGDPVTVLVQGESGVGKSAVVRHYVDQLSSMAEGVVVLTGRCYERETVPYKAFDGIVDALSRYMMRLPKADAAALLPLRTALLAQVFPVLRRVEAVAQTPLPRSEITSPQELRVRVFAALRELLQRLGERHPLVLVIDDLQWADADSLALLGEVLRTPDAPMLLFIATVRVAGDSSSSGSGGSLGLAGALTGDVRHVHVQRLPPEEARELVGLLLGSRDPEGAAAQAIAEEAAGHPLFIDELVRHATSTGDAHGGDPAVFAGLKLDDALWARILRLEAPVRQLLELVVVAGGPLMQEAAAAAASTDFGEFGKRVSLLRVANLVRTTGARRTDAIEPYHDRVREAVLQHLDARARKRYHERLAVALEGSSTGRRADPEALSTHWRGAGDAERAAHYASEAASQAATALAFDRAARLYRLAIELRPIEGAAFHAQLGGVLANAGRGGEAALAFLEAAKGASHAESIDLQRRAAEQLLISGHVDAGLKALGRVLEVFGMKLPSTPREALASFLWRRARLRLRGLDFKKRDPSEISAAELTRIDICWSVGVGLGLVDNLRGADYQARHLLAALEAGEPYRVARGLATELVYLASTHKPARAAKIRTRLEALVSEIKQPHAEAIAQMAGGMSSYLTGHWKDARASLERAETILRERCTGVAWELDTTHVVHLFSLFFLGELPTLLDRVPAILRNADERGDLFARTNLRTGLHLVWLVADDPERARTESAQAMRKWSREGFHTQHYYDLIAQTQSAIYLGDGELALKILDEKWPLVLASQQMRVQLVRVQLTDLRARALLAAAAVNKPERKRLYAEAEQLARKLFVEKAPWIVAHAAMIKAAVAEARGDTTTALAQLDLARSSFTAADMKLHAIVARRERGRLLLRTSDGDEGRAQLTTANEWLKAARVRNPARLCALLAPGFPDW